MEARSVEAMVRVLNEAEIRYLVVGGLAVNAPSCRGADNLGGCGQGGLSALSGHAPVSAVSRDDCGYGRGLASGRGV